MEIPRDPSLDSTLALLSEGYRFISRRCQRYRSDIFQTLFMLRKAFCVTGDQSPFDFIPQGGGNYYRDHRCAGEWLTIELMKRAVSLLTTAMCYEVPERDLSIDFSRMPAVPTSRFVTRHVERIRPLVGHA